MRTELTQEEKQATIDAIARFRNSDPDLKKQYEIEFVITNISELRMSDFTEFLKENNIDTVRVERRESDLFAVICMRLDRDRIIDIESYLTYFANKHSLKYDGWGAFE